MSENAAYFASFFVTQEYLLLLKIGWYKEGSHLKYNFGVGRSLSLSLSLSFLIVCVSGEYS